jgi:hypothetical protein
MQSAQFACGRKWPLPVYEVVLCFVHNYQRATCDMSSEVPHSLKVTSPFELNSQVNQRLLVHSGTRKFCPELLIPRLLRSSLLLASSALFLDHRTKQTATLLFAIIKIF